MFSGNYRKVYERAHGPITAGFDVHHKIPIHAGGTNDLSNLEALSRADHAQAHLRLYELNGDFRDLAAYNYLKGDKWEGDRARQKIVASMGGKASVLSKKGIHSPDYTRRKEVGAFSAEIVHRKYPELAKAQGAYLADLMTGSWCYTDGVRDYRYKASQHEKIPFRDFLSRNPQFWAGKTLSSEHRENYKGRILITDGEKDFWLPQEYRENLQGYLLDHPTHRAGKSRKRAPFTRRTKLQMSEGTERASKRRKS